jgi:16S rRNA (guanine1207-N2)-methyltransferase
MAPANESGSQAFWKGLASGRELTLKYHRQTLHFRVSQELFSSFQIDTGTRLLLKTVRDLAASGSIRKVLDLGCGYGPLGLALAKTQPQRLVHLVDRDALAVEFTRANAQRNEISNVKVYGSLGYDDVADTDFDLLLSNIPGKAGRPAIDSLLLDARHILQPQGVAAVVVVPPLAAPIAEILDRPDVELLLREEGAEHVVFHYRFLGRQNLQGLDPDATRESHHQTSQVFGGSTFERGVYDRGQMEVSYRGLQFNISTVRGLPEFDKLSHQTELLFSALQKIQRAGKPLDHALVFNPGQGHVPVALYKQLAPQKMTLVDRDLLSLRASARNLLANGRAPQQLSLTHQSGLPSGVLPHPDLILGVLRDSEGPTAHFALLQQAAALLVPQGELLVAASSTTITRLEKTIKKQKLLTIKQRKRNRAKRLLILISTLS